MLYKYVSINDLIYDDRADYYKFKGKYGVLAEKNWNDHLEQLEDSIKLIGLLEPLLVIKEGKKYNVIRGHHRAIVLKRMGQRKVPCILWRDEYATTYTIQDLLERFNDKRGTP